MQSRLLNSARSNALARTTDNTNLLHARHRRIKKHIDQKHMSKKLFQYIPDPGDVGALGDNKMPRAFTAAIQPPTIVVPRLRPNQDKLLKTALMAIGGVKPNL